MSRIAIDPQQAVGHPHFELSEQSCPIPMKTNMKNRIRKLLDRAAVYRTLSARSAPGDNVPARHTSSCARPSPCHSRLDRESRRCPLPVGQDPSGLDVVLTWRQECRTLDLRTRAGRTASTKRVVGFCPTADSVRAKRPRDDVPNFDIKSRQKAEAPYL
jgi:hypothetical protein